MKKLFPLAYLCIAMTGCTGSPQTPGADEKPNILFIAIDDLRDWTGYTTQFSNVITPNLDRLARGGTVFSNAHCAAPVCKPSRTALLTGVSPGKTGVYVNGHPWPEEILEHITLTRHFMDEGYYTAGFGKIYHGQGSLQYWDEFIYGEYSPSPVDPPNPLALGNPLQIHDTLTGDGMRVSNAIRVLERDRDTSLFLACGLVRPHTPWDVPRKYFDMYPLESIDLPEFCRDDLDDIPPIGRALAMRPHEDHYNGNNNAWPHQAIVDSGLWKINIQAYLASITFADAQLGRLLDAWEKSRYAENGIILVWGDHGWHHGEKEHWSKRTLWEVGTRTPLIIHAPGYSEQGDVVDVPVSLLDIYPTLLELTGTCAQEELDGVSLVPQLKDNRAVRSEPAITIYGRDNVSVRSRDFRYIRYCDGTEELYDHRSDPGECTNLSGDPGFSETIAAHREWLEPCRDFAPFFKPERDWFGNMGLKCDEEDPAGKQ